MDIEFSGFRLDTQHRRLIAIATGEPVALSVKAIDLLIVLVERAGQVVDKDELMRAVWPRVVVEENNLERHVSMLRKALGERPGDNRYIATEPGRGYRFVAATMTSAPSTSSREAFVSSAVPPAARARTWPRMVAAAAGVLVVLVAWYALSRTDKEPPAVQTAAADASLAVMPFANLTGDASMDYLGDGLAEELIHRLSRDTRLRVAARTSSFAYANRTGVREIGRDLGVAHVLEGSVRGDADSVRVTVQLVDAANGFHVWSQTYERQFRDVFALQEELAAAILQRLSPGMQAMGTTGVEAAAPTRHPEAYRAFLQANAMSAPGEASLARARALYDRALEIDPTFARAWAARATTRGSQVIFGLADPIEYRAAEADARRALALEPELAAGHATLGTLLSAFGRWSEALHEYAIARELDGGDPQILLGEAMVLASLGQIDAAVERATAATHLAPLAPSVLIANAAFLALRGEDAEAVSLVNRAVALGASPSVGLAALVLAETSLRAGRPREAADHILKLLPPGERAAAMKTVIRAVYEAYENVSGRAAAAQALREFMADVPVEQVDVRRGTLLMLWFAMVDDIDSAYYWANRALDYFDTAGAIGSPWFGLWSEQYARFRADSRFPAFVARLKMVDYWKVVGAPQACVRRESTITCEEFVAVASHAR